MGDIVEFKRPEKKKPKKPEQIIGEDGDTDGYPLAHLGEGWPPEDMLPPSDVS